MFTLHVAAVLRVRVAVAFARAMPLYWFVIFPRVSRELGAWRRQAHAIPDAELRQQALDKLDRQHLTAEGAAAYAILADRRRRGVVVRLCVAFEVMFDFLDALTEAHPTLENNRRLHSALAAAFDPDGAVPDFYLHHLRRDDGGYLTNLVRVCRTSLVVLPAHRQVIPALLRASRRAAEAQSLNHTSVAGDDRAFAAWAAGHAVLDADLRWWEIAAAAGSPPGIFALAAAACDVRTSGEDARAIEDAYFPWIAALHWLLDSLVDQDEDLASGGTNYVAHYGSSSEATARLGAITTRAVRDVQRLPRSERHMLLLAGMVGMNLTHRGASSDSARESARAVHAAIGGILTPFLLVLRARRAAKRLRVGVALSRGGAAAPPSPNGRRRRRGGGRR